MKPLFFICAALFTGSTFAQKTEQFLDFALQPVKEGTGRYWSTIENKNGLWYREVWHHPEKTIAVKGSYLDKDCKQIAGTEISYQLNGFPHQQKQFANGKPDGVWLIWNYGGRLVDSAFLKNGHRVGIGYRWHQNGKISDSLNSDGQGNGSQVSWDEAGKLWSTGRWTNDSLKDGRWQYFFPDGKLRATEDYVQGKRTASNCFDANGKPTRPFFCEEREAEFDGGSKAWIQFLQNNLKANVPLKKGAPVGVHTVIVRFIVEADGDISGIYAVTKLGYGMEEEVMRVMKKSPKWVPASQFGRPVKAYRSQPVSFAVQKG